MGNVMVDARHGSLIHQDASNFHLIHDYFSLVTSLRNLYLLASLGLNQPKYDLSWHI